MKTQAILVAAGLGTRLKSKAPKPLILINKKPMVAYSLGKLQQTKLVESIILVVCENCIEKFKKIVKRGRFGKVTKIIKGGKTRQESVLNGLAELDRDTDFVLVHDAARPLVTRKIFEESIKAGFKHEGVVVGVPIHSTVKQINNTQEMLVEKTLDRNKLWMIQTPQVFRKDILLKAHAHQQGNSSDDAILVENLGVKVKVVAGDYKNIKITTKEDLQLAKALLKG